MEDSTTILFTVIIGLVISYLILYMIIRNAVWAAVKSQTEDISIQNRLLIKLLEERGVSKKEITELYHSDLDTFWGSIKENEPLK